MTNQFCQLTICLISSQIRSASFVPAVDPGILYFDSNAKLVREWSTSELGLDSGCAINSSQKEEVGREPKARWAWINRRKLVDEIIELPVRAAGLVIREFSAGKPSWKLLRLSLTDGSVSAVSAGVQTELSEARIAADTNGDRIAMLVYYLDRNDPRPRRVHILRIPPEWQN